MHSEAMSGEPTRPGPVDPAAGPIESAAGPIDPAAGLATGATTPLTPPPPAPESGSPVVAPEPTAASEPFAGAGSDTSGGGPASSARADAPARRSGPRTGPIVWGALILAFCAYVAQRTFGSGPLDTTAWVIVTVLGLGVLLLGVGFAVILRNRSGRR